MFNTDSVDRRSERDFLVLRLLKLITSKVDRSPCMSYNLFTNVNKEKTMLQITNAEWEVMRVVWTFQEVTSAEIIAILGESRSWSASTIKTMLTRLVEKDLLSSRREGRRFYYRALMSEEEGQWSKVSDTFSKICVTKHHDLIAKLLLETPMTQMNITALENLLANKRHDTVESVVCQCLPGQCSCHK